MGSISIRYGRFLSELLAVIGRGEAVILVKRGAEIVDAVKAAGCGNVTDGMGGVGKHELGPLHTLCGDVAANGCCKLFAELKIEGGRVGARCVADGFDGQPFVQIFPDIACGPDDGDIVGCFHAGCAD